MLVLLAGCSSTEGDGGTGGAGTTSTSGSGASTSSSGGAGGATSASTSTGGAAGGGGAGGAEPISPTPEECEVYTTEEDCLAAGCRLFFRVTFVEEGEPDVCGDATGVERDVCFQLRPDETYSYPAGGLWHRERDGELEVIIMSSSYCGLLGWTPCANDPEIDPTPLCPCGGSQVCPEPTG